MEADTLVFLHVKNITKRRHRKIVIRTVDTNVLVLALSVYEKLKKDMEELQVEFGARKNREFFPVHEMTGNSGESKAHGLPFFHVFTRFHQALFLSHVNKGAAWYLWSLLDDVAHIFETLRQQPTLTQVQDVISTIERYTVLLQSCISNCLITNECRRELFCQGRSMDNIPATSAVLGSILCDQVILLEMWKRNPWLNIKCYQVQKTGDGKWKITS